MSGHSKWNNIKRKKEKTDGAKAKVLPKSAARSASPSAPAAPTPLPTASWQT